MITSTKAEILNFPEEWKLADSHHKMQMLDSVCFIPEECITLLHLYVQKVNESSVEPVKVFSPELLKQLGSVLQPLNLLMLFCIQDKTKMSDIPLGAKPASVLVGSVLWCQENE